MASQYLARIETPASFLDDSSAYLQGLS